MATIDPTRRPIPPTRPIDPTRLPLDPTLDVMPPPYAAPKGPILPETLQVIEEEPPLPDYRRLQMVKDQVQTILHQLQANAGPRGATFAGRTIEPGDTPASIMGRLPAGGVPGEEGLVAPVTSAAVGTTGFLAALREVVKGLKGKFPSSILEQIIERELKLGKPPNPRDVPPLTESQRAMMAKMRPEEIEKAVGMSRRGEK